MGVSLCLEERDPHGSTAHVLRSSGHLDGCRWRCRQETVNVRFMLILAPKEYLHNSSLTRGGGRTDNAIGRLVCRTQARRERVDQTGVLGQ